MDSCYWYSYLRYINICKFLLFKYAFIWYLNVRLFGVC
jgi:hypothetical protein